MALRRLISNSAAVYSDVTATKNARNAIFSVRDKLRGTTQFSEAFYKIIGDINHPPRHIEANQSGGFWSEGWDAAAKNYEPYTTQKLQDSNIGYTEGCAIYLLIQECYPTVYDFPSNSMSAIQNGATIKLIMKKQFLGKKLKPATVPPRVGPVSEPAATCPVQPEYPIPPVSSVSAAPSAQMISAARPRFCSACGNRLEEDARFCTNCGKPIG